MTTAVEVSFERVSWSITRYGHTRVRVCGELDIRTAPAIEADVFVEVAHTGDRLVIDLAALTFIDSTGLRMLVKLNHHELERGRPVTFVTGYATTRRVLELERVSGIRLLDERGEPKPEVGHRARSTDDRNAEPEARDHCRAAPTPSSRSNRMVAAG